MLSMPRGGDWAGYLSHRPVAARIDDAIAIIQLDGTVVRPVPAMASWLGEDLLVRRGFVVSSSGGRTGRCVELADTLPAFTDPTPRTTRWRLEANGWGRVRLQTQSGYTGQTARLLPHRICRSLHEAARLPRPLKADRFSSED
jgi:hypothetical protein